MELKDNLKDLMSYYIDRIRDILQGSKEKDNGLLAYYFVHLLEMKARLERMGESINAFPYRSCCNDVKNDMPAILTLYRQNYNLKLPEKVISCARRIEENLELLSGNNHNDPIREEIVEEMLEECFDLVVQGDTLELIQQEMEKVCPNENFESVQTILWHTKRAFRNIYFPPGVQKKVKKYVQDNHVDTQKMPWFCRPTIDEMPIFLECEREEAEAEAVLEMAQKHPIPVPAKMEERLSQKRRKLVQTEKLEKMLNGQAALAAASDEKSVEYACFIWQDDEKKWEVRLSLENCTSSEQEVNWDIRCNADKKFQWKGTQFEWGGKKFIISERGYASITRSQIKIAWEICQDCVLHFADGSKITLYYQGEKDD